MKRIATAALFVLICGSALAESANEKLVVPPYPGGGEWKKITDVDNAAQIYFEWIPAGQSEKSFTDILIEQAFYKAKGLPPGVFVKGLFARLVTACDGLKVNGPVEHVENGFPIAYAQEYCAHQKGTNQDVDIFVKVISGKDALYVIQREFHRPMQPGMPAGVVSFPTGSEAEARAYLEARAVANKWLDSVQLCPTNGSSECPAKPADKPAEAAAPAAPPAAAPAPSAEDDPIDRPSADDVSGNFGFTLSKTKSGDVIDKYGRPGLRMPGPNGHFTMLYEFRDDLTVVFLFNKHDVLVRTRAYGKNR